MSESNGYILVADDDALVLRSLTFVLERAGFTLRTATNGAEALAIAEEEPPVLALLDVMMPEMTGLELCRTLKNSASTKHVPVFLVTARAMVSERARGIAAGADAYITKPFVNKELILFSRADLLRSIPSVVDGFKPSQRKVLFSCFKRKLRQDIKVAQLSGYVSEHSAYHHGEASLASTIVGLAQDFVGSNNVNLLVPSGQFGTRLQGGKDHASPRYIFTRLAPICRTVFPECDDALLEYLNEDGQVIEPEHYLPIIPLVLVNGAEMPGVDRLPESLQSLSRRQAHEIGDGKRWATDVAELIRTLERIPGLERSNKPVTSAHEILRREGQDLVRQTM